MKKYLSFILIMFVLMIIFVGCHRNNNESPRAGSPEVTTSPMITNQNPVTGTGNMGPTQTINPGNIIPSVIPSASLKPS